VNALTVFVPARCYVYEKITPFIHQVSGLIFSVQRELGTSRQEHDIGPGSQPEKEEQKQRKDNR
jgi:hypothetical protein